MSLQNRILDNQDDTVVDHLQRHLRGADAFNLASAYFTIYGYQLLAEELDQIGSVRFLFGDPTSVEDLDPGTGEPKSFDLTERGLEPNHTLQQKALAKQCAGWVSQDSVAVRSISRANFLHGKLYLIGSPHGAAGVVGSSNFTQCGLGGSARPNLEINLAIDDAGTITELNGWFNQLWRDEWLTKDVKQEMLDALARLGGDYAPETVYYKTLYELFRKDIDARLADGAVTTAVGFTDSQIWNALYEFQKDGAKSAIAKLREHNGCILADSVGLGKTYTALAVIKYFELHNQHVLVLCPRKLFENWFLYPAIHGHRQNPFREDRFSFTVLAHTDLSRNSGSSGGINLAHFNWQNYDLVVIDESHNFRNDGGQRYRRLLDEIIKAGAMTKVLMLSATPVNTSLIDLRNQIYLMTEGRESAFRESLGVGSIRNAMASAQKVFKQWETGQANRGRWDKAQLLETLGADFLRLLDGVSISRSRRQIEQFYAAEMERVGQFPHRESPTNHYPRTDLRGELSYRELAERIGQFKLSVYQPSAYVIDPARRRELAETRKRRNFNQRDSERFLVGMIRTNFLKRLESSPQSLTLTLGRTIGKINGLLAKIDRCERGGPSTMETTEVDTQPAEDEEDDDFAIGGRRQSYRLSELDVVRWRADLQEDKIILETLRRQVVAITPERDGKLCAIKRTVRNKIRKPTTDRDGNPNRKLLVFTTFKDTANYLYYNLTDLAMELGINMAMASGDETRTTAGDNNFNAILTNFAPKARNRGGAGTDINLLIATDCISEGQNLQDCDTVLNYDIHWNPVRIIQRFGRIDRIGSRNKSVRMINYWPTSDMDAYLKLENRVQARMALADLAASGDEDPFTEKDAQLELSFRDEQLLRLREEILDLDDLSEGPSMGDFTLDHFLTQLLRYLEANKDRLEAMPPGVYAVAHDRAGSEVQPGVIFCLRQRNADHAGSRQRAASPVHPFHFVYLHDNGSIRYGCTNARQALAVFEAAAAIEAAPITELCDRFDRETDQGRDMSRYDKLLTDTLAHIRQSHSTAQMQGLGSGRDFVLPKASESPNGNTDFELIAWLIVKGTQ